jgi:hypothetical protein
MSNNPLNNLCRANGPGPDISTAPLWAFVAAVRALDEVTAAYAREEEADMLTCGICGVGFLPADRWRQDWCPGCFEMNFAASQERRLHDPSVDALREATHRHYEDTCRAAWPPTPRQVEAMRRVAAHWRREEDPHAD